MGAPSISHLLFVDDLIFFKATGEQVKVVKVILKQDEEVAGHNVNFGKSSVTFGKGIAQQCKDDILLEQEIREVSHRRSIWDFPRMCADRRSFFVN